ncbi:DUF6708 domain-containing protein [Achromobacter kerstersii]|uniref:DUF6708 domain-containing protein n=1 Tax=Achromobacter kerstersii TaxID=1353890 RepID=A0A6S7AIU0_9BURK|nr:DUF6708 domain-containing protein [Achromobacter kerstersii]CAB3729448.1 hypothetical protein LMG3441_04553 [Achromobacter kerstersii]
MARSKLNPPCAGWQRDLPGPNDPTEVAATLREDAPNHVDEIYMELSRRSSNIRGLLLLFVPLCAYFLARRPLILLSRGGVELSFDSIVTELLFFGILSTTAYLAYRFDVSPPRDLPIRFNRARRRIYVYGFHMVWWNPFTRWYVTTASYPWDDVRAEVWEQWGATSGGGLMIKWGVSIAIVKPNTNDVIERFHLSTYNHDLDNVWAYVCTYMQQGPQALPPCNIEPRNANDVPAYNLALRWAPRVEWPKAMDWESRSSEGSRVLEGPGQ